MNDIEAFGAIKQYDYVSLEPTDCLTIIYTSGSSGFPKGAMISEETFRASFPNWCLPTSVECVCFSYRPLAWATDRDTVISTFLRGGRTGFFTGDSSRLMEELALVRPTHFSATPSIWNKIYAEFQTALALFASQHQTEEIPAEEERLLKQFSKLIPVRCKGITIGGALVSPVVSNFMKRCFTHCTLNESYGISECGGVTFDNRVHKDLTFRLESVSELGYTIDDRPYPRGELLIRTRQMFSGYVNNPEETHAALTDDGFFRTGDIVELRKEPGRDQQTLHVIDRKKNFFKLSQGQFVSPEFLQSIYIQSAFVEQIYIHGDLLADSVTAVIVPNRDYAQAFIRDHTLTAFDMHDPDPLFNAAVLEDLRSIATKELLRKHEIPSRIIIDFEAFTPENGLLTSTMKYCRHKLARHYADRLKSLNSIEQRLQGIFETVTGQNVSIDDAVRTLFSTGADSLSAVRLSRMIEHDLGVPVPLNVLFDPHLTLQRLTALIQNPSRMTTLSTSIVSQMLLDTQLDLNVRVDSCKNALVSPSMIFITGATGFVGAFLLAELLAVHSSPCRFVCLVRCEPSDDPMDRVRQSLLFYQIWNDEYRERITALRGDLSETQFGLDKDIYESLVVQTDMIFHCGASVNFLLPYNQLHGSNVCGTREIIRFATHNPSACIPVQYVSTLSVLPSGADNDRWSDELLAGKLIGGYAQSKWVAEKLMINASQLGLPVVIYRLGLIGADSKRGSCNPNDVYTLLLAAMIQVKAYPSAAMDSRVKGLPVDLCAKSIVCFSGKLDHEYGRIHHVSNAKSDLLFSTLIDSTQRCGLQLSRASEMEWRQKVQTLSEANSRYERARDFLISARFHEERTVGDDEYQNVLAQLGGASLNQDYCANWIRFVDAHIVHKKHPSSSNDAE